MVHHVDPDAPGTLCPQELAQPRDEGITAMSTAATEPTTCTEWVPGGRLSGKVCGRKAARDGMCGLHAAAQDRRREQDAAQAAERAADHERFAQATRACEALADVGITAQPHYRVGFSTRVGASRHTGAVVIAAESVEDLLRRVAGAT